MNARGLHVLAIALLSVACVAQEDPVGEEASPIIGGEPTADFAAVGALTRYGRALCTGTVIGRRVVLTAAHCLTAGAAGVQFVLGPITASPDAVLEVTRVTPHPGFNRERLVNDVGVVILAEDAPVAPVALNATMDATWVGRYLDFVGYGSTNGYTHVGGGRKRTISIPIARVATTQFAFTAETGSTCFGDSGGPAFTTDASGRLVVTGVTSYGDATCSMFAVDTRVDAFAEFIAEASK